MANSEIGNGFDPSPYVQEIEKNNEKIQILSYEGRILWFWHVYPNGKIFSQLKEKETGSVVFETKVYPDFKNEPEHFLANGIGTGFFNADDPEYGNKYYEKAETASAVRALRKSGIGVGYKDIVEFNEDKAKVDKADKVLKEPEITERKILERNNDSAVIIEKDKKSNTAAKDPKAEGNTDNAVDEKEVFESREVSDMKTEEFEKLGFAPTDEEIPEEFINANKNIEEEVYADIKNSVDKDETSDLQGDFSEAAEDEIVTLSGSGNANLEETDLEDEIVTVSEALVADKKPNPAYTKSMQVEEITALMSYEEAEEVVVTCGFYKGFTIKEILQRNAPALAWYISIGNKSDDNIVRAAVKIVMAKLAEDKKVS